MPICPSWWTTVLQSTVLSALIIVCSLFMLLQVYSIGEVRMSKRRLHSDPFEKFVSRLNAISPESSSTPVGHTVDDGSDNTLSDMPSIHHDKMSTPVAGRKHESNLRQKIRVIPYHKRYPLVKSGHGMDPATRLLVTGGSSPGEVPRHILNLHVSHGRGGMKDRLKTGSTHSIGELHVHVEEKLKAGRTKGQATDHTERADSPKSNSKRDGIDVIDISRHSAHLSTTKEQLDEVSSLDSVAMDDVIVVQPSSTATQVIQVRSYESSETSRNTETATDPEPNQPSLSITRGTESKATQALDTLASKPLTEVVPKSKEPLARTVGTAPKPLTVVVPTAEVDNHVLSSDSQSSVSENIEASYTSDFDFSSVSIPGL